MANVIPFEERKILLKRQKERYVFVGSVMLLVCALVANAALIPALIAIRVDRATLVTSVEQVRAEVANDQAVQVYTQGLLDSLNPIFAATTTPSTLLTVALQLQPPGISITSASYTGGAGSALVLSGTSQNRQALNAFRDALEKEGRYSSVVIPVAALVGTQDGRFTITLSGFK